MDFEQTILSTLLKYNDIFDAFQKLFNLHNYNCAEQRQKLQSFLTTKKQNDCIYITLNKQSDVIPFQEDFERQEKKFIQLVQDDRVYLERYFQQCLEKSINLVKDESNTKYSQQEYELTQHLMEIAETYSTKLESRQMKSIFEEKLLQQNQQLEYLQAKFALKQQTDQSFADIENSISNMSQTMHYQRQDILKIGKQLNQLAVKQNQNYNEQTESITKLNEQLKRLDFTESQINQLDQSILTMHQENEQLTSKFKSIAQLFQELDANTTNQVKFEIHQAIKSVNEEIYSLENKQQSFQNQIASYKESVEKQSVHFLAFKQQCENQFNIYENEMDGIRKFLKKTQTLLDHFKQIHQNENTAEMSQKLTEIQFTYRRSVKYYRELFNHIRKVMETIQDFCETSQIPSLNQEKDLTNLILLLDRRMMDFERYLSETERPRATVIPKLQTPRQSFSIDSTLRIHSKNKYQGQKYISQTISIDSKRETIS